MRQTNNALNFLNASYQAVFKHSYVAGLASTVALLSISPYASANGFADNHESGANTDYSQSSEKKTRTTNGYANSITINGVENDNTEVGLNITYGSSSDTFICFTDNTTVKYASLSISGSDTYSARLVGSFNGGTDPIQGSIELDHSNLDVLQGRVRVNQAKFTDSTVTLGKGLVGQNGHKTTDTLLNYSALRTGQADILLSGEAGDTTFYNSTLKLWNYSALDAMGKVTFDRSDIIITAAQDTNGTDYAHGELEAKAVIRAPEINIGLEKNAGNLSVAERADKAKSAGAIYATTTNLNDKGTINVAQNSKLQLAGMLTQTSADGTDVLEGSNANQNISTTIGEGVLNLKGTINNNGELVLGGISIYTDKTGTINKYTASKYDVTQTGGVFNNTGTLRLGDVLKEGITTSFDQTKGTSYTLTSGSFNNTGEIQISKGSSLLQNGGSFNNTGVIQLNSGSAFKATSGDLTNYGKINVESSANLYLTDNTKLTTNQNGSINIKQSGQLTISAGVLSDHSGDTFFSVNEQKNYTSADLSKLNEKNIKNSGSLILTDGIFTVSGEGVDGLGSKFAKAINAGTPTEFGNLKFANAVLKLNSDLDISTADLYKARVYGQNSTLYTDGYVTFTTDTINAGTGDNLNGFTTILGKNVIFKNNTSAQSSSPVMLSGSGNANLVFAATESVSTKNDADLSIENFTLRLTNPNFLIKEGESVTASTTEHYVNANLQLKSGSNLEVEEGTWNARAISATGDALIHINGLHQNADDSNSSLGAKLAAQVVQLKDTARIQLENSGSLSAQSLTINNKSQLQLQTNSKLEITNDLLASGGTIDLNQSSLDINNNLDLSGSTFNAQNNSTVDIGQAVNLHDGAKVTISGSNLKTGSDFSVSGSSRVDLDSTPTTINGNLSVDTDGTAESGLYTKNSALNISGNATLSSNGKLQVNNDAEQSFNVSGNFNLNNSAQASLEKVNASIGSITQNSNLGLQFTDSQLSVNGDIKINSGSFTVNNSEDKDFVLLGNLITSGSVALTNVNINPNKLSSVNPPESGFDITNDSATSNITINDKGSLSLASSTLNAKDISLTSSGTLTASDSTINAQTLNGKDSASMTFINTEITLNGDDKNDTVDITGNITLNGGTLNLGDALDSLALTYDSSKGFKIGSNDQFDQIKADQGAVISLDVSQVPGTSVTLTLSQANALADKLFSGNGIVRFEGNTQPIIDNTYNEALGRHEVDFNDIKNLDLNVSTDETRNAVLVNVDNTGTVSGEWKAIETAEDPRFKVGSTAEGKKQTLSILGTTGNNNLAQDKNGNTVGVVLGANSALNLEASGNIGSIVKDELNDPLSATLNVGPNANIKVNPLSGETTSQIRVGNLNSQSNIEVDDVFANQAKFSGGGLTSDTVELGELTANDATFNVITFTAGNTTANSSTFKTQEFTAASFSGAGNTIEATNITFTNGGEIKANNLTATNTLDLGQKIIASASNFNAKSLKAGAFTDSGSSIKAETVAFTGDTLLAGSQMAATTGTFTGAELKLDKAANVTFGGNINVAGNLQVIGGSTLTANTLQLGSGDMYIGSEDVALSDTSSTGKVILKNLDLNGRNLFLDPEFGQAAAIMFVNNIGSLADVNSGRYNTQINGNIVVGRNSALGLGGTEAEFNEAIAKHQDSTTKSFKTDGIGAMLYVNRANIQLGDNKLLISTEDIANLKQRLETDSARIYLGDKSGLQVTARAINEAHGTVNGLVFSDLDSKDVIESKDGTLILPAGVNMDDLKSIFGSEVTLAENSKIQVTTENGLFHGVIDSTDDLRGDGDFEFTIDKNARTILSDVSTPTFNYYVNAIANSGIVEQPNSSTGSGSDASSSGDLAQNGDGQGNTTGDATQNGDNSTSQIALLANNDSAGSSSTGGSTDGETGGSSTGGSANGDTNPDDPNGSGVTPLPQAGAGYLFLSQAGSEKAGRAIEQSARLASFGMSMQIAQQAGKTTSDAIGQRLGMRAPQSSNPSVISNGGTAVWFTPVYKNYSSSSFSADDLNYGTDFDLYGAAVGMDYTFNNGLKVGGLINFGQGDADGSGIASGVSNDFSYYGVGLFASFQPLPDLTLSADATYTVVDNDLETMADVTGYNKITASADSDAFSLGVNAQYDMRALGFNVTPHAGMRYTRMSVDNYTIKADGERIGRTTADSADILSIPVGVALSSEFKAGNWVIQPRADFEVTANFGSDSAGSSTTFDGAVGTANYNTEFMDSITYGVNGGLQMTNGNFSFGANIGYTGSSHTDELNVGANVMFKF